MLGASQAWKKELSYPGEDTKRGMTARKGDEGNYKIISLNFLEQSCVGKNTLGGGVGGGVLIL